MNDERFWEMVGRGIFPRAIWEFTPLSELAKQAGADLGLSCGDLVIIQGFTGKEDDTGKEIGLCKLARPVDKIKVAHAMQATKSDFGIFSDDFKRHFTRSEVTEYDQDVVTVTLRARVRGGWGEPQEVEMTVAQAREKRKEYAGRTLNNTMWGEHVFLGVSGTLSQQIASGMPAEHIAGYITTKAV